MGPPLFWLAGLVAPSLPTMGAPIGGIVWSQQARNDPFFPFFRDRYVPAPHSPPMYFRAQHYYLGDDSL